MTTPTQNIKRSLFLHKISNKELSNSILYKKAMDSIFCKPETYFSNYFNNKEVVIGKKTKLLPIGNYLSGGLTSINKQIKRKSCYQGILGSGIGLKRANSTKNILLNTSSISTKHNIQNTKELRPNQRYIDDNELKKMFDDFRYLQEKNSKLKLSSSAHNILEENSENNIKHSVEHILNSQEKSLNLFKKISTQNTRMINRISKKIRQNASDLNINHIRNYRMKKEIKNDLGEQVDIQNDIFPSFDWELSLRNDPNFVDKKYINYGSVKHPSWHFIVMNPKSDREIIRQPKRSISPREQKEMNELLDNDYLKDRINCKGLNDYKLSPRANFLDDLQIKGKDLLTFEQENSKLIKGKKILFLNNDNKFNKDTRNNFIISRNWSLPVSKKHRSFS